MATRNLEQSLSSLRRKRGNIIGQITSFVNVLNIQKQLEQPEIGVLRAQLDALRETWKRFDDIQYQIEELDESEQARRFDIINDYCSATGRASEYIRQIELPTTARSNSELTSPITATIKLPEMRLPSFDGTIENWSSFFDIFSSTIDRNNDLTPVQKLQYLRSSLTGTAAACIASLATTDANYTDAIDLLKQKFDCPRRVILKHCNAILDHPRLIKDTPEALGNLVDAINQNLRALKNLNEDIVAWNSIVISIILSKLSSDTVWQWELTLKDNQMPSLKELLSFLEKRANCSRATSQKVFSPPARTNTGYSDGPRNLNNRVTRSHAFASTHEPIPHESVKPRNNNGIRYASTKPKCPICNEGQHFAWECEEFHALPLQIRAKTVDQTGLCRNCLRTGHTHHECDRMRCRICHDVHHTLLHQPKNRHNRANVATPFNSPTRSEGPEDSQSSSPR
ncbi:uncharacterized protein LOC144477784 [Augochlora pura]